MTQKRAQKGSQKCELSLNLFIIRNLVSLLSLSLLLPSLLLLLESLLLFGGDDGNGGGNGDADDGSNEGGDGGVLSVLGVHDAPGLGVDRQPPFKTIPISLQRI
jgi:hypothetical protein